MAVETVLITNTTSTTVGTKDFTSPGFGTAQAAIIFFSRASAASNPQNNTHISIGFTDGVRDVSAGATALDGLGTTSTGRYHSSFDCLMYHNRSSFQVQARFDSWITDGIRLNFTAADGNAYYIQIVLLKGLTNVRADTTRLTSNGINDITDVGFKPDLVLCTHIGEASLPDPARATNDGILCFGAAHNSDTDTVTQGSIFYETRNNRGVTDVHTYISGTEMVTQLWNGAIDLLAVAQDFDADGFSINTGTYPGFNKHMHYIALKLDSANDASVNIIDTPIITGNQSYTSSGFQPNCLILAQTFCSALDTITSYGTWGVGTTDGTSQNFGNLADQDAISTSNAQASFALSAISELYNEDGSTTTHDATLASFDTSGFSLNFSKTDTTARKWLAITLKDTQPVSVAPENSIIFGTNF